MASAYGNMTRYTYSLNEDRETRAGCENSIESDESELFCSLRLETHSASKSYAKYLDFGRLLDEGIGTPTSAYGKETEAFRAAESGTQKEEQSPQALSGRDANPAVATPRGTERRGFAGGRALRHVVPRIAAVESAGAPEGLGGALYPWIPPGATPVPPSRAAAPPGDAAVALPSTCGGLPYFVVEFDLTALRFTASLCSARLRQELWQHHLRTLRASAAGTGLATPRGGGGAA